MKKTYEVPECLRVPMEINGNILVESLPGESQELMGTEGEEMSHGEEKMCGTANGALL